MNDKKPYIIICYLFSGIFVVFIGMLTILATFLHCDTNIYDYFQVKSIMSHKPYIYIGLALLIIAVIMLIYAFLERIFSITKNKEIISQILFYFCGAIILLAGICWILFNDSVPVYDQKDIYAEALRIAGVVDEPFDTAYFTFFHRNRGIVLLISVAIKLFGPHLYSFQIFFNLAASLIIYYSVCKASRLIYHNPVITSVTSLLLMLFYPLFIYTSFIYGTLLSIAFTSLGLYAVISLCETGKTRYGILMAFAFPIGIMMHQSAAIGLVASAIYLIMNAKGKLLFRNILLLLMSIVIFFLSMKTVDLVYNNITGADADASSVPVTCTIYMGITSTTGDSGPGSQDGSYTDIFIENNCDGEAASQDALQRISLAVKEYFTGERSFKFFLEKTEYQWLDPSFGARKIIRMNNPNMGEPSNSEAFTAFYNSSFRTIIFKLSIGAMLAIYIGALISGIKTLRAIQTYPAAILVQLYVIGGAAFQLIWESLSRYCLNYYIWLILEAAFGLYSLYGFVKKTIRSAAHNTSDTKQ